MKGASKEKCWHFLHFFSVTWFSRLSSLLLKDLKDTSIILLGKGRRTGGSEGWGARAGCSKWLSFSQLSPQHSSPGSMAYRSSWRTRWWGQISQTPASWLPWIWPAPTVRRPRRAWLTSSWAVTVQVRHWNPPQSLTLPHTGYPGHRVYVITRSNSFTFPYTVADVCN